MTEQEIDPVIMRAKKQVSENKEVNNRQLRRVRKQLRIEKNVLTKSGRPIIQKSLQHYVTEKVHKSGKLPNHFGIEKTYQILKRRLYWSNMYKFLQNYLAECKTCNQCKVDYITPRAPLIPIVVPDEPMAFISIDIAYMEPNTEGYKYLLIMVDIFSKYIEAVPTKDQQAPTIVNALWKSWITRHSCPRYILSDQGSNVDGASIRDVCTNFGIEKRRTSSYHSQGNSFAERNIRSIREIMRTLLLDQKLPQSYWRNILPTVVFSINSTESAATKCIPFEVIYGKYPTLPYDIVFGTVPRYIGASSPVEYLSDLKIQMSETMKKVRVALKVSRSQMQKEYNKKVQFFDYKTGEKVWMKKKRFKPGENRKLSPRKTGPWTVIRKCNNGVNFEIENDKNKKRNIIHHNRLFPYDRKKPVSAELIANDADTIVRGRDFVVV